MEWFSQNWVWVLFFAGMIAMHMFGHGGHGGHDEHRDKPKGNDKDSRPPVKDDAQRTAKQSGHQH